jgi:hypothetical protein
MSSKIVIIGVGCASSMRQDPPGDLPSVPGPGDVVRGTRSRGES